MKLIPKTPLGWIKAIFSALLSLFLGLVSMNLHHVAQENGWDEILSENLPEAWAWMSENILILVLAVAFFGGAVFYIITAAIVEKIFPTKPKYFETPKFKFRRLSQDIFAIKNAYLKEIQNSQSPYLRPRSNQDLKDRTDVLYAQLKQLGVKTPNYTEENRKNYNSGHHDFLNTLHKYSEKGLLKEAKTTAKKVISRYEKDVLKLSHDKS